MVRGDSGNEKVPEMTSMRTFDRNQTQKGTLPILGEGGEWDYKSIQNTGRRGK